MLFESLLDILLTIVNLPLFLLNLIFGNVFAS